MPPLSREFTRLGMTRLCAWVGLAGAAGVGLLATWRAVLLAVAVSLGGCAALPHDVARPASSVSDDVDGTALARAAVASMAAAGPGGSGFRTCPGAGRRSRHASP